MRKKSSFTLIELIVVIAIIAVLAAIIAPNAFKAIEKAKIAKALAELGVIKQAVNALHADTGHFPGDPMVWPGGMAAMQKLIILDPGVPMGSDPSNLIQNDSGWFGWDGPYLESLTARTPWGGTNLMYRSNFPLPGNGLWLWIWPTCYNTFSNDCPIPESSALIIDQRIDDGDPLSGNVLVSPLFVRYKFLSLP